MDPWGQGETITLDGSQGQISLQRERQENGRESGLMSPYYEIKTLWILFNLQATTVIVLSLSRFHILCLARHLLSEGVLHTS